MTWTCREINSPHIVASVGHSIEYNYTFYLYAASGHKKLGQLKCRQQEE